MGEEILVVSRERLMHEPVHGFTQTGVADYLARVHRHAAFKPRERVEEDPSLKQIIPYLIVRCRERLFLFQRSPAGGETRLRGLFSIGVGGHINRADVEGAADFVEAGLRRELSEELHIDGVWHARLVGVLNDDTNPVGQVHFGLVHVVEVDSPAISVRESGALAGRLADSKEVRDLYDKMESWSQLILDAVDPMSL